jgi:hypothetical protein
LNLLRILRKLLQLNNCIVVKGNTIGYIPDASFDAAC